MENKSTLNHRPDIRSISGWIVGTLIGIVGVLNMFLVHPVPGIAYLLLSLVYFPPANAYIRQKSGFAIPTVVKIILAIVLVMFTLGVSDLGDMIDKL